MTEYQEAVCDLMAENGNLRAEIERLRSALRKVRAIVMDDTADPLGSLDTIDQALMGTPGDYAMQELADQAQALNMGYGEKE